jgi:hypothetical protein
MPTSAVAGLDEADMFRVLDPTTMDVLFWGERFNLQEIVNEVRLIQPLVALEAAKPHWPGSETK